MDAAVVELYALADAVGTGGEDDHAGLLGLVELGHAALLVGEVVVARARRELTGAGVDGLDARAHAEDLAHGAHGVLTLVGEVRELRVREAKLLGGHHRVRVEAGEAALGDDALGGHDVLDAVQEPVIDLGEVEDALDGPAAAQRRNQ